MRDSFKKVIFQKKKDVQNSKLIAVRMPVELSQALSALSKKSGKSVSRIMIEAVRFALEIPEKE